MAVTKRTRFEVLRRDNHACRYCGAKAPEARIVVDHVLPVALGGSDDPSNLVAACDPCNSGKASTSPTAEVVGDVRLADLKWAEAMARAAAQLGTQREAKEAYIHAFGTRWEALGRRLSDESWYGLERLYEAGLPEAEMLDVADMAALNRGVNDRFAYFMGICWKRVAAMQAMAKELLAADEASD